MWSQFPRILVIGVASLVLSACGGGGGGDHKAPPAPTSITIVSGNNQTGIAGSTLPAALVVSVKDAAGRAVAGATVSWAVVAGGGSVTPTASTTDSAGLATTNWTLGTAAGANRVTATSGTLPAVAFDATATAAVTASVTVSSPVEKIYEGDTVQLTAIAKDAAGNVLSGKTVTWSSDDNTRFPVSAAGLLNTWGYGVAIVTATIDGIAGNALLSVDPINLTVAVGKKEVVFDYTTDRCEELDLPDLPTRMVRAEDGSLVYFAGNAPRVYASRGADFNSLKRDCSQPVLVSADRRTPESYENWEWIWSVYRVGSTWHALVHNEYHDTFASTCDPGNPSPSNPCWYNSVTHAVSTDGGHTFTKPLAPAHVIAPAVEVWTPPTQMPTQSFPIGFVGGPIIRHTDGYYYAIVNLHTSTTAPTYNYVCLIRTDDLDDPSSWRAWDGSGFSLRMASPYVTGVPGSVCPSLSQMWNYASLSHSTYLDRYVGLGNGFTYIGGRGVCGIYLQLSSDLIHWSRATLVVEASLRDCPADPGAPGVLEPVEVIFPTFIDHADTSVNFENIGQTPYLYYVRFTDGILDRDVVRVPVTFTRTN